MAKDFRSRQVRSSTLIASGGLAVSGKEQLGLLIYSSSAATNFDGGRETAMLNDVGTDVWMFVSGTQNRQTFRPPGLKGGKEGVLVGGDVCVSGTLYAESMVVELDQSATGSLLLSGSLFVSQSATIYQGLTVNELGGSAAVNDFRVESDGEDEAIFLDASANILYINKGNTAFETHIESTNAQAINVTAAGVVFNNETNANNDFRVAGANDSHLIFADASLDRVSVGVSTDAPGATLEVYSDSSTGVPAFKVTHLDVDKLAVDINAANTGAAVLHLINNAVNNQAVVLLETSAAETNPLLELRNSNAATDKPVILSLNRTDTSADADDMSLGTIRFDGTDAGDAATSYVSIEAIASDIVAGDEGGKLTFNVFAGGTAGTAAAANLFSIGGEDASTTPCEVVVNEAGIDCDFRVESDGETHMLFIEGSSNRMSIGDSTDAPLATVEITNASDAAVPLLQLNSNDTDEIALDINAANITDNIIDISSDDALTTGKVLHIDVNNNATTGITPVYMHFDFDKDGVVGDGVTSTFTAWDIDLNDLATNHANAIVKMTGMDMDVVSANDQGTLANYGLDINVSGADANYAAVFRAGSVGIGTATPAALLEIEQGASGGQAAVLIDNDDTGQIALDIDAANQDANVIDITADALTTGNALNIASDSSSNDSRNLVYIKNDNTSATNTILLNVVSDAVPGSNMTTALIECTANTVQPTLTVRNSYAGSGNCPVIELDRSNVSGDADDMLLGYLQWAAPNASSNGRIFCRIIGEASDITGTDEGGRLKFEVYAGGTAGTASSKELLTIGGEDVDNSTPCSVTVNEDGIDCDFRVETDNQTHMFFIDGGNDKIGIGNSAPGSTLEVTTTAASSEATRPTIEISSFSDANDLYTSAGVLKFHKSANDTINTYGAGSHTAASEVIGRIEAWGVTNDDDNSSDAPKLSSYIEFAGDAVADETDVPGKIIFATADADDNGTPTVRLTIDDDGLASFVGAVTVGGALTASGDVSVADLTVTGGDVTYGNGQNATLSVTNTAAGTAGKSLTLTAGGVTAGSGTANRTGGDLVLSAGAATGTGTSSVQFKTAVAGSSGTSAATPAERMRIHTDGNVGIGNPAPGSTLEISKVSGQPSLELSAWSTTATAGHAGVLKFQKAGTATVNTFTAGDHTTAGEILGRIEAWGVDDADGATLSSYIEFANDAVSDADSTPGKIVFATSDADDAGTPTVRLTIDDDGLANFVGAVTVGGTLTVDGVGVTAIQTAGESFSDNDTSLMTSAAIDDRINTAVAGEDTLAEMGDTNISSLAAGHILVYDYTASVWDNVALTAGDLIDVTGGDGTLQVDVDLTEASSATIAAGDFVIFLDGGTTGTESKGSINDVATLFAGTASSTGLSASSGVMSVSDLHPVGVDGSANNIITDDGDGTVTSESKFTFDGKPVSVNTDTSGDAAENLVALHVDFDRTVASSGTNAHNDIGIDLDVDSRSLGTSTAKGMDIDVTGHTDGTHTVTGIDVAVSGGDINYAALFTGGNVGIGVADPDSSLEILSTSTQQKWSYDADSFASLTIADASHATLATGESGNIILDAAGAIHADGSSIVFKDLGTTILTIDKSTVDSVSNSPLLTSETTVIGFADHVVPNGDLTYNLGSANNRWANIYTGDLHLKNERGDWTVVEEESYLSIRNNKTGKRYKFVLEEIDEE